MATRWIMVCHQDAQPIVVSGADGFALDCSGQVSAMPVDTVITESSPLLNLGQLLAMTPDDALVISTSIAAAWAVAWGIRLIAQSLNIFERNDNE